MLELNDFYYFIDIFDSSPCLEMFFLYEENEWTLWSVKIVFDNPIQYYFIFHTNYSLNGELSQ